MNYPCDEFGLQRSRVWVNARRRDGKTIKNKLLSDTIRLRKYTLASIFLPTIIIVLIDIIN